MFEYLKNGMSGFILNNSFNKKMFDVLPQFQIIAGLLWLKGKLEEKHRIRNSIGNFIVHAFGSHK